MADRKPPANPDFTIAWVYNNMVEKEVSSAVNAGLPDISYFKGIPGEHISTEYNECHSLHGTILL